jgi:hypothetical protein
MARRSTSGIAIATKSTTPCAPKLEEAGMVFPARAPRNRSAEMMELPADVHPWFVGVPVPPGIHLQPAHGHPLFIAYVKAALAHNRKERKVNETLRLRGRAGQPLFLIAGPCVIESREMAL